MFDSFDRAVPNAASVAPIGPDMVETAQLLAKELFPQVPGPVPALNVHRRQNHRAQTEHMDQLVPLVYTASLDCIVAALDAPDALAVDDAVGCTPSTSFHLAQVRRKLLPQLSACPESESMVLTPSLVGLEKVKVNNRPFGVDEIGTTSHAKSIGISEDVCEVSFV